MTITIATELHLTCDDCGHFENVTVNGAPPAAYKVAKERGWSFDTRKRSARCSVCVMPKETIPPPIPGYSRDELGPYEAVFFSGYNEKAQARIPIGWGHIIRRHLDGDRFNALRAHGSLECLALEGGAGNWCVVRRWLTPEDAAKQYGAPTLLHTGPSGGFRSITYGKDATFTDRRMCPKDLPPTCRVVAEPRRQRG